MKLFGLLMNVGTKSARRLSHRAVLEIESLESRELLASSVTSVGVAVKQPTVAQASTMQVAKAPVAAVTTGMPMISTTVPTSVVGPSAGLQSAPTAATPGLKQLDPHVEKAAQLVQQLMDQMAARVAAGQETAQQAANEVIGGIFATPTPGSPFATTFQELRAEIQKASASAHDLLLGSEPQQVQSPANMSERMASSGNPGVNTPGWTNPNDSLTGTRRVDTRVQEDSDKGEGESHEGLVEWVTGFFGTVLEAIGVHAGEELVKEGATSAAAVTTGAGAIVSVELGILAGTKPETKDGLFGLFRQGNTGMSNENTLNVSKESEAIRIANHEMPRPDQDPQVPGTVVVNRNELPNQLIIPGEFKVDAANYISQLAGKIVAGQGAKINPMPQNDKPDTSGPKPAPKNPITGGDPVDEAGTTRVAPPKPVKGLISPVPQGGSGPIAGIAGIATSTTAPTSQNAATARTDSLSTKTAR